MGNNHILEVGETPTVNPNANAGDDYIHIQASPDAFGAQIGKAEEGLGQATTNVGTTGLEIATQRQNIQDDLHNSDVNTWHDRSANDLWSKFSKLQGQSAINALPQFKSDLEDLRQKAIAQAGNDNSRVAISKATAFTTDQYNKFATNYGDQQFKSWRETSDTSHAANQGSQSTISALQGDLPASDVHLAASGAVIASNARAKGFDDAAIDQMVKENTGSHVMNTVQQLALTGKDGQPDIPAAQAYFAKYQSRMDTNSQAHAEEWLKSRSDQYAGRQLGTEALTTASAAHRFMDPSSLPSFAQAAQSNPGSMSPAGMARLVQIESSGNPNAGAGSAHVGLVQAGNDYWNRYGEGSRLDPNESIAALGRSTAADSQYLSRVLGRQPSDAELYLAHQQGAGGAQKLLANPNARAGDLVGDAAIRGNGGDPNAPASAFTNKWIGKFNGPGGSVMPAGGRTMTMPAAYAGTYHVPFSTALSDPLEPALDGLSLKPTTYAPSISLPTAEPPLAAQIAPIASSAAEPNEEALPSPLTVKAAAYQRILARTDISDEVKQHALSYVSQQIQAQQIADQADAKSKADLNDRTAGTYFERIENGDFKDIAHQIANDRRMTYETREKLTNLAERATGESNVKHYGSGYADAYRRVMLPENDPQRIVDPLELYRQGAPGGPLTPTGVGRLVSVMGAVRHSVNDAASNRVMSSSLTYAQEAMTYTIPSIMPGQPDKRDPKGMQIFNSEFVPRFEAAVDAWTKQGKSLWDPNSPIQKKSVDAMIDQVRPKRQMAQDQLTDPKLPHEAQAEASEDLLPSPPPGVDREGWSQVVSRPPMTTTGGPYSHAKWAAKINLLAANPTPQMIEFFDQKFGKAGYDGREVLARLNGRPPLPLAPQPTAADKRTVGPGQDPAGVASLGAQPGDQAGGASLGTGPQ